MRACIQDTLSYLSVKTVSDVRECRVAVERWTPQRRRELTRSALVDAAAAVFARRGFDGSSLDEIAETAGFTRGAIYKNFDGKEDLFFAVFDRQVERNLAAFADRFGDGSALDLYDPAAVAQVWRDVLARDLETFTLHLELRLYALRNPDVRARYAEHLQREHNVVAAFIEEQAAAAGVSLRLPAAEIAAISDAASEGFLAAIYLDPSQTDLFRKFLELMIPVLVAGAGETGTG
jgi:AcrR family transcriptional regulator